MKHIPKHIAIIMDGNRRWAREHGLPVLEGHRRVTETVIESLVEHAAKRGIGFLTFWAWSTENWQRDKQEVLGIMRLFRTAIKNRTDRFHKQGVRVKVIGDLSKFPVDIKKSLEELMELTKNNKTITVTFALNYGGRDEILRAMRKAISRQLSAISQMKEHKNAIQAESCQLTAESFSELLDTAGTPDPDMIVRTGGEQRMSGFLPWQGVYSEYYFPSWYMPDFSPEKLDEVIEEYERRSRRFGK